MGNLWSFHSYACGVSIKDFIEEYEAEYWERLMKNKEKLNLENWSNWSVLSFSVVS